MILPVWWSSIVGKEPQFSLGFELPWMLDLPFTTFPFGASLSYYIWTFLLVGISFAPFEVGTIFFLHYLYLGFLCLFSLLVIGL